MWANISQWSDIHVCRMLTWFGTSFRCVRRPPIRSRFCSVGVARRMVFGTWTASGATPSSLWTSMERACTASSTTKYGSDYDYVVIAAYILCYFFIQNLKMYCLRGRDFRAFDMYNRPTDVSVSLITDYLWCWYRVALKCVRICQIILAVNFFNWRLVACGADLTWCRIWCVSVVQDFTLSTVLIWSFFLFPLLYRRRTRVSRTWRHQMPNDSQVSTRTMRPVTCTTPLRRVTSHRGPSTSRWWPTARRKPSSGTHLTSQR